MKQLSFGEFQEAMKNEIHAFLPQGVMYETQLNCAEKNNVSLQALAIHKEGENMSPNFFLEPYYKQYQSGDSLEQICKNIGALYEQLRVPDIAVKDVTSYEAVRDSLEIRLVSKENNEAYLKKGPFRCNEIGAEIVHINLEKSEEGQATIRVTNELMGCYHITPEALFAQAYHNTVEQYPLEIKTMVEVLQEFMSVELQEVMGEIPANELQMYVISNQQRLNGATVILYPDALKKVEERVGGEYYILPSSTQEVLAVPKNMAHTEAELRQMVREINRDQVEPTERLSGEVFAYDSKENQLQKCIIRERGMER